MKLIVGLGNPDKEYLNTFHNLGFMAIDKCASELNVEFCKTQCKSVIAETRLNNQKIILAKPQTYMNLSGEAVRELLSYYKIELSNLLVIYDDFDLNKGVLRLRESGSAGTHNGMRNIVKELGSDKFARIRIGFKSEGDNKIPLLNLVLSGIKAEDKPLFEQTVIKAGKAASEFAKGIPFQNIMQQYNRTTL